ncbi:vesicle coat component [Sporothrix stenoceras]|uniref:Protein transport protein sec16 n=1 Tax=Sporothrix stenoceras TaxID=5173 RepID=A0ABR3Z914_9PEZI
MSSGEPNAAWHPAFMPHTAETPAPVAPVPTESTTSTKDTKEPLALDLDTSSHDAHDESGVDAWFPEYDAGSPWTEQPPTNSFGEALAAPAVESVPPPPRESTPEPTPASAAPAVESTPEPAAPTEPTETTPVASSVASPVGETASKHFSTISFTRTVANDVNWDAEEDEPEWNISRTDTDPFQQFMPTTVDRSNSFPVVPPQADAVEQMEETQYEQQPLASTQAMDIIQEIDSEVKAEADKEEAEADAAAAAASSSTEVGEEHTEEGIDAWGLGSDSGDVEDSFFAGAAATEDKPEEVVPDARFEEGLPLISQAAPEVAPEPVAETVAKPTPEAPAQELEAAPAANDPFGESNGDDDDFFNNAAASAEPEPEPEPETTAPATASAPAPAPPAFERKSTFQVIQQSLSFDAKDGAEEDSFFASKVEDGPIHEEPEPIESETSGTAEKTNGAAPDLADQWAALLDDDEDEGFLEDSDPTTETESKALDPAAFFGDDDEGFLEDDAEEPTGEPVSQQQQPAATVNRYLPQASPAQPQQPQQAANPYLPTTPFASAQPVVPSPYASPAYGYGTSPAQAPPVQDPSRPTLHKAQSFADKSKGGYSSPYDLPMDIVKQPKKRQSMQQLQQSAAATSAPLQGPPPRSSSMQAYSPNPNKDAFPAAPLPPAANNRGMAPPPVPAAASAPPAALSTPPVRSDSFFEDLPMLPKVRPASRHSQHSPAQSTPYGLPPQTPNTLPYGQAPPPPPAAASPYAPAPQQPQTPSVPPPNSHYAPPVASTPVTAPPPQQVAQTPNATIGGLVAPPRANPYASLQNGPPAATPPAGSNRYSPSPNQLPTPSAAGVPSRYSPAPPPRVPSAGGYAPAPTPPILAHQPRTSSPLAHFEMSYEKPRASSIGHNVTHADGQQQQQLPAERRSSSSVFESRLNRVPSLPPTREEEEESLASASAPPLPTQQHQQYQQRPISSGNGAYPPAPPSQSSQTSQYSPLKPRQTPPPQQQQQTNAYSQATLSPPKRILSYAPQTDNQHSPPRRSQTQSPGALYGGNRPVTRTVDPIPRPSSVHEAIPAPARPRAASQNLNLVPPTDGSETDPLQRWKGVPIFAWGVGGIFVSSFPQDVPRYGMNQALPMIHRAPGEVVVKNIKEIQPLDERLAKFPGPLKGKSKKKEVLAWLTAGIEGLERSLPSNNNVGGFTLQVSHEDKRLEERVLLWKILHLFIEHDGVLEGNPAVEKAVRDVLSPGAGDIAEPSTTSESLTSPGVGYPGFQGASSSQHTQADAVDSTVVEQIRKNLLLGEKEKAVWDAVDKRLWGHAFLIAGAASRDLFKKVAQEFVRKEVNTPGLHNESLAALYEVLSGNHEECVDELVPVHARAGLHLMTTTQAANAQTKDDELAGLDKWRETLGLILSNRSVDDVQAINSLGNLLSGYGRAEAAHVCFLFSRSVTAFGGLDDPAAQFVLLGADHKRQADLFAKETDAVLLSEVYEYGLSLTGASSLGASNSPHLTAYKLQHAMVLSEYGLRDKALQYCESIAAAIGAQTRRSGYYHPLLETAVEDLMKRLKSAPKEESNNSWIPKPSMNKVSDTVWNRFNKFVAGDDNEGAGAGADGEAGVESGPFSRIAGGTPTISRPPSASGGGSMGATGMEMFGGQNNLAGPTYGVLNGAATTSVPPPSTMPPTRAASRYAPGSAASQQQPTQAIPIAGLASPPTIHSPYDQYAGGYTPLGVSPGSIIPPAASAPAASAPAPALSYNPYEPAPTSSPAYAVVTPSSRRVSSDQSVSGEPASAATSAPLAIPTSSTMPTLARKASEMSLGNYSRPGLSRKSSYAPLTNAEPTPPTLPTESSSYNPYAPPSEPAASAPAPAAANGSASASPYAPAASPYTPAGATEQVPPVTSETKQEEEEEEHVVEEAMPSYGYQAPSYGYEPPTMSSFEPVSADEPVESTEDGAGEHLNGNANGNGYSAGGAGYEPPSFQPYSYEPPSYEPVDAEGGGDGANDDDELSTANKGKAKSFMDDDGDDIPAPPKQMSASEKTREEKDRENAEMFRKIAEEEAKRAAAEKEAKSKKGWGLTSWWGKKDAGGLGSAGPSSSGSGSGSGHGEPPKAVRANLGEKSSFYFDPELKRWVNKNASPEDQAAKSTPPPPPPRSNPHSATSTPAPPSMGMAPPPPSSAPPPSGSAPPMMPPAMARTSSAASNASGPPTGPPSRPATSMSDANSIDDLLGATPGPRKAGAKKGRKSGRYVDVMAK